MKDIGRADYLEWKSIEILWVVIYKISTFLFGNEYDAITNNVREPGILLGSSRLWIYYSNKTENILDWRHV